jgi:hypothetical protein
LAQSTTAAPKPAASSNSAPPVQPKTAPVRARHQISTPSIKDALSRPTESEIDAQRKADAASNQNITTKSAPFSQEKLDEVWNNFAPKYKEEVFLYNTLQNSLTKLSDQLVKISVENSVQEDQIRSIKPEIIGFLHRNLDNETIDLEIELGRSTNENKAQTEDQKLQAMISKNPALFKMKSKFNLDING